MKALEDTVKKEFFRKPSVAEIREGKEPVPLLPSLVETIDKLESNEYIIIKENIIPYFDRSGVMVYEDWQNFLKRGSQVNLEYYISREQAIAEKKPFWIQREERFKLRNLSEEQKLELIKYMGARRFELMEHKGKLERNFACCGFGWWGIRDKMHRKVHLYDCRKGSKLFALCEKSKKKHYKIEIKDYDDISNVEEYGGKYMLKVPSMSENKKYGVTLESVPVGNGDEQYANVYNLRYIHSCGMLEAGFSYRYKAGEIVFCPHVVAAYLKVAQFNWRRGQKMTQWLNPFALLSQRTARFSHKSENNVIIKPRDAPERVLNKAEIEIELWDWVKRYSNPSTGPYKTFYADRRLKLQNYDW